MSMINYKSEFMAWPSMMAVKVGWWSAACLRLVSFGVWQTAFGSKQPHVK